MNTWNRLLILGLLALLTACSSAGESLYTANCSGCHDTGRANTPPFSNTTYWQQRRALPYDQLLQHSIQGYTGSYGIHPPRGGYPAMTDEEVKLAMDYLLERSQ